MALFALVALAVGKLVTSSLLRTAENRHGTAAAFLAQRTLEELRGRDYDDIAPGSESHTLGGQPFTVTTGVQEDTPAAGMKEITVTVDWVGPEGTRYYETKTIYTSVRG
jgi:hypothetical protein